MLQAQHQQGRGEGPGRVGAELKDRSVPEQVSARAAKPNTFDVAPRRASRDGRSSHGVISNRPLG